jgi:hypothetical protein
MSLFGSVLGAFEDVEDLSASSPHLRPLASVLALTCRFPVMKGRCLSSLGDA